MSGWLTVLALILASNQCTIRGVVADDRGVQLPNIEVTLGQDGPTVLTGPGGAFVLEDVAPGRHTVWAHAARYSSAVSDQVQCGPGQTKDVYLVITRFMP